MFVKKVTGMKTKDYLYRSQLNDNLVYPFLCSTAGFIWFYHLPPLCIPVWLLVIIGVLFHYLLLAFFQSHYYFYDDHIVRVFTFRPFCRKTAYRYEQIFKVEFNHGWYPIFFVYQKKRKNNILKVLTILCLTKKPKGLK